MNEEFARAFFIQPGEPLFYSQMVHYDNDEAVLADETQQALLAGSFTGQ